MVPSLSPVFVSFRTMKMDKSSVVGAKVLMSLVFVTLASSGCGGGGSSSSTTASELVEQQAQSAVAATSAIHAAGI